MLNCRTSARSSRTATNPKITTGHSQPLDDSSAYVSPPKHRQLYFNRHRLSKPNALTNESRPITHIYGAVKKGRRRISTIYPLSPNTKISKRLKSELIQRVRQNNTAGEEVERVLSGITQALAKAMNNDQQVPLRQLKITDMFNSTNTIGSNTGSSDTVVLPCKVRYTSSKLFLS